ncbi:MAG: hypothetical protein K5920_09350 [Bacteroidales bacterium]|nr:hypothetical protein [Bacteroidales bacterium]
MKKILTIFAALAMGCACYFTGYSRGNENGSADARRELAETSETWVEPVCWGDVLMEDYLLDVIDETDFWEECDSTAFSCYEYLTSEWYLAVICEYNRNYK